MSARKMDPAEFGDTPPAKPGRKRKLQAWQISYARRAALLRKRLSRPNLARRFGISTSALDAYANGMHKDWPT